MEKLNNPNLDIKPKDHKKTKKIFWIMGSILFIALFVVFYLYFAPGLLIINSKVGPVNIYIYGKEPKNIEKFSAFLKPGEYSLLIEKDNYLPSIQTIIIKPLWFTKINAFLTKMNSIGSVNSLSGMINNLNNSFSVLCSNEKYICYFNDADNTLYRMLITANASSSQETSQLQSESIGKLDFIPASASISRASWSTQKDKIIISDNNNSNWLYDLDNKASSALSSSAKQFAFSPDGKKIAYIYNDHANNKTYLSIANPDGTNWQNIKDIDPSSSSVAFSPDGKKIAYIYPKNKENILVVYNLENNGATEQSAGTVSLTNYPLLWSSDNQYVIYNNSTDSKIYSFDTSSKQLQTIDLKIYQNLYSWIGSSNNFIALVKDEKDAGYDIYQINPKNGEKTKINRLENDTQNSPQYIFTSSDGKKIYLQNNNQIAVFNI